MSELAHTFFPANPDYVSVERHVLQDNINLIDAKSGILMALSGGFIARCLDKFFELANAPALGLVSTASLTLYAISAIGFFLSAYFTWFVLKPRVTKTNDLVYWGSEAFRENQAQFVERIEATDPSEFRLHFLRHLHILARICRQKYRFFGHAVFFAQISLLTTLGAEICRYARAVPRLDPTAAMHALSLLGTHFHP